MRTNRYHPRIGTGGETDMARSLEINTIGKVVTIAIHRPDVHNAFDDTLVAELIDALTKFERDANVRAIVLTGTGATFSAGADLNWMRGMARASEADNRLDAERLAALLHRLNTFPKPTLARVNGAAYGGGVGLIACCDIAIAADTAKFGLTEVKLGLVPAVISPYVVAATGVRQARRLFVTGETFDAAEALRIGLVHHVVAASKLDDSTDLILGWLGKGAPLAQHEAKQLALRLGSVAHPDTLVADRKLSALIARLRVSPEGQEGLTAFLDKRKPKWEE
jgi:methylglutaconyl-CoA hydratase